MPPSTGLVINAGVTVNAGVTLNGFASAGGGSGLITGSMTVGDASPNYGYIATVVGAMNVTPAGSVGNLYYLADADGTVIEFPYGTHGSVVVDFTGVNGSLTVSLTLDGVTQSGSLSAGTSMYTFFSGDPFGLQTKSGQTLPLAITLA